MEFSLAPVPPFSLELTVWALRRRPHNVVDRWDGQTWRRVLAVGGRALEVAVTQSGGRTAPLLRVEARPARPGPGAREELATILERMLGLRVSLTRFYGLARGDPLLGPLARRFRGLKPPRYPTLFESLVNAIACQQISLTVGIVLLNRLAETFGLSAGGFHAFPRPEDLAGRDAQRLRGLGFSRQKTRALLELAEFAAREDLEAIAVEEEEAARRRLLALRGVGRWSAEYALLRGAGRLHVFPGDDVGARKRLARWLAIPEPKGYDEVRRRVAGWQPYAGMVYFHLLLQGVQERGALQSHTLDDAKPSTANPR